MNTFFMRHRWHLSVIAGLLLIAPLSVVRADSTAWIMVDVSNQTLAVMQGQKVVRMFRNISTGRNGFAAEHFQGDGKTPLGSYRVAWINLDSKFQVFFGLDYPNEQQAEYALQQKVIDIDTYFAIRKALYKGEIPPQDTALGGHIGIHGIGKGNPRIHDKANWTEGCIALTNEQIDELTRWVTIGTKVIISETGEHLESPAVELAKSAPYPGN